MDSRFSIWDVTVLNSTLTNTSLIYVLHGSRGQSFTDFNALANKKQMDSAMRSYLILFQNTVCSIPSMC